MPLLRLSLWVILLCHLAAADPVKVPDAATLQLINEGRDGGSVVKAEQVRLLTPVDFPEATLVGFVSGSTQCLLGAVIVDGQLLNPREASGVLLRKRGWESASAEEKKRLAFGWLVQCQFGFGETMLERKPSGWPERDSRFREPEFLPTLTGSARVLTWVEDPPGLSTSRSFRRMMYWFGSDGRLLRAKVVDHSQTAPGL